MCNCKVILYNAQDDFPPELHQLDTGIAYCPLHKSAPELLSALQVLVEHARETYPHFESERGRLEIFKALLVIAKATGNTASGNTHSSEAR